MKILQKRKSVLYRFRCSECYSQFEMTEEEYRENDREYGNPFNKFFCPICDRVELMKSKTIHKYAVLEYADGRTQEYCEY